MPSDDHALAADAVDGDYDAEAWRAVGASMTAGQVHEVRAELHMAMYEIADKLYEGERVTAADVNRLRELKDELQHVVEDVLAHLADDTEPWAEGAGDFIPYAVMRRQIEEDGHAPAAADTEADGGE